MTALGVIFIAAAAVVGGAAFWVATSAGAATTSVELFNNQLSLTPLTMFLSGGLTIFLLLIGLSMIMSAGRRRARKARERRDLEKQAREQERELAQTKARLAADDRSRHEHPRAAAPTQPVRPEPTRAPDSPGSSAGSSAASTAGGGATAAGPRPDGTFGEGGKPVA